MFRNSKDLSSLRFQIKVNRLSNFAHHLSGSLYIRCYVIAGSGRKICIDTQDVLPTDNLCWDEMTTMECQVASGAIAPLLELHKVVFELRCKSAAFLGRFTCSKILGRGEVAWKDVLASSDMCSNRWIRLVPVSTCAANDGHTPPSLLVELKVQVVEAVNKHSSTGRRMSRKQCSSYSTSSDWLGSEEDIFQAAIALSAF